MPFVWNRPVVPYPNVWTTFEAKESKNSDKVVKYRIQDVPEDRFDEVIDLCCKAFVPDEPILRTIDAANDPQFISDFQVFIREILGGRMSVICVRDDTDEIAGVNILTVYGGKSDEMSDDHDISQFKSKSFADILKFVGYVSIKCCPYEIHNEHASVGSIALAVAHKYRGLQIGTKLLASRKLVAQAFNMHMTHVLLTSDYSNTSATNAGFEEEMRIEWSDIQAAVPGLVIDFSKVQSEACFVKSLRF